MERGDGGAEGGGVGGNGREGQDTHRRTAAEHKQRATNGACFVFSRGQVKAYQTPKTCACGHVFHAW